jgi:hypothetical protein
MNHAPHPVAVIVEDEPQIRRPVRALEADPARPRHLITETGVRYRLPVD